MRKFAASMMMVLSVTSAATLAGVSTAGAAQAKSQATYWCAAYKCGGENCGFSSQAQCSAAVSGVGGFCRVVEGAR